MFFCHLRTLTRLRPASGFSAAISTLPNEHLRGFAPDFQRAWRSGVPVSPSKNSSSSRARGDHRVYCRILPKRTRVHTERPKAQALPGRLELPTLRLTASRSSQLSYGSSCAPSGHAASCVKVAPRACLAAQRKSPRRRTTNRENRNSTASACVCVPIHPEATRNQFRNRDRRPRVTQDMSDSVCD